MIDPISRVAFAVAIPSKHATHTANWLIDYNTIIPHSSLNYNSPVKYLLENHFECHMYWTYTSS